MIKDMLKKIFHWTLVIFVCFIFIQSLYFKFTNSPETQYIFIEKLDVWATSLGYGGVFARGGLFSAVNVGIVEMLASIFIICGAFLRKAVLESLGAFIGILVLGGAISFHLFTPLGISVRNADGTFDGGQLFLLACGVFISCLLIIFMNRSQIRLFLKKLV